MVVRQGSCIRLWSNENGTIHDLQHRSHEGRHHGNYFTSENCARTFVIRRAPDMVLVTTSNLHSKHCLHERDRESCEAES